MRNANLNVLAAEDIGWTLKRKSELLGECQRFGLQQSHSSLTATLYKLQRKMALDGMMGHEPLIPIIIHEALKRQVSQQDIENATLSFDVIDPDFRQTFAVGISLISADLCRNLEPASSTILQFYVREEQALNKLLELPDIFQSEQWAIRLRPFLSKATQHTLESQLCRLVPKHGEEPSQRLMSSFGAYIKLAFDQSIMPTELISKPHMAAIAKSLVSHLLCAERMIYQANEGLLRMLSGWIRQNILLLDDVAKPFQAAERVKQLCPGLLHDPRHFPETWKKSLLVDTKRLDFTR